MCRELDEMLSSCNPLFVVTSVPRTVNPGIIKQLVERRNSGSFGDATGLGSTTNARTLSFRVRETREGSGGRTVLPATSPCISSNAHRERSDRQNFSCPNLLGSWLSRNKPYAQIPWSALSISNDLRATVHCPYSERSRSRRSSSGRDSEGIHPAVLLVGFLEIAWASLTLPGINTSAGSGPIAF